MTPIQITPFSHPLHFAKPIFKKATVLTITFGALYKGYDLLSKGYTHLSTIDLPPHAYKAWIITQREIERRNTGY